MSETSITRRDFLKLSSATLLGLLLSEFNTYRQNGSARSLLGRVLATSLVVRDAPAFTGKKLRSVKRDVLLELDEKVYGGESGDYNRYWYKLADNGYVYSGWVQLVEDITNSTLATIPSDGILGEITIPFTDSAYGIPLSPSPGPRLYYASNHWIIGIVTDPHGGKLWYKANDAATQSHYFIQTEAVHLFSEDELSALSPQVAANKKHIEIYLDRQLLLAFEWDSLVYAARVATGRPGFESPIGVFQTFHKRPTFHMFGGADEFSIFDLPGVPWDSYITDTGVALHGTYWHNDFGKTHSHGCINMSPADAKWVYRWTLPTLKPSENFAFQPGTGTRVEIRPS